jgi:hypothetical protein
MSLQTSIEKTLKSVFPNFAGSKEVSAEIVTLADHVQNSLSFLGTSTTTTEMHKITRHYANQIHSLSVYVTKKTEFDEATNTVDTVTRTLKNCCAPFSLFGDIHPLTQTTFVWTLLLVLDEPKILKMYEDLCAVTQQSEPESEEEELRALREQARADKAASEKKKKETITRRVLAKKQPLPISAITIKPNRHQKERRQDSDSSIVKRFIEFVLAIPSHPSNPKNYAERYQREAHLFVEKDHDNEEDIE